MNWLEQHSNGFFKLTGIMLLLFILFYIWATYDLGVIPKTNMANWTAYQWDMVQFFWSIVLIDSVFYTLFAVLSFKKKHFVFPCIVIYMGRNLSYVTIESITQIFQYGFIDPSANIASIVGILTFALAIIGTLLFTKRVIKRWA